MTLVCLFFYLLHYQDTIELVLLGVTWCYRLDCGPPNSYARALIPNVPVFGQRISKKVR